VVEIDHGLRHVGREVASLPLAYELRGRAACGRAAKRGGRSRRVQLTVRPIGLRSQAEHGGIDVLALG